MDNEKILMWFIAIVGAIAALLMTVLGPNDPALPEVVYDRDGVPWTQDGERIEEDHPLWDCKEMGNRECGTDNP